MKTISKEERARLIAQYKEIPIEAGVYQIRNKVNGKVLVDTTPNLKSLNGRAGSLNLGTYPNKELQREWDEFGEDAFAMEVLEVLKPSDNPFVNVKDELKQLEEKWIDKLQPFGDRGYHKLK
ncbi:GIY-YIG nuclease family protein [Cohnella hongkongensis]|uniref:GIY-YIG nuclease family protein n=1 Tax=Cohnella hongkongensis TaxID=178337 RepID=A0ABV9F7E7_9BACL